MGNRHTSPERETVDLDAFHQRMKGDGWAFLVILSPDPERSSDHATRTLRPGMDTGH